MILSFAIAAVVSAGITASPVAAVVSDLPASITERIARHIPKTLHLVEIELSSPIETAATTPVAVEWKTAPRAGSNSVRLTFQLPGGAARRWAFVRLAPAVPVLVYRRALPAGHVLSSSDLDVTQKPKGMGLDLLPSSVVGRTLSRGVSAEEPVTEHSVDLPAPVPSRSPVHVVARVGLVEVSLDGTLARPARPGGRGKVRVTSSGRTLRGRLVDRSTFVLDAPGEQP